MPWVPIDLARARELIAYDPITGLFTYRRNWKGPVRIGAVAGAKRPDGYARIIVDGGTDYAHRLAWMLEFGPIPEGMEIDHIDQDPSNNRIANLRLVTRSLNRKNRSRDSRNKSGVNGVHWSENAKAWAVQVRSNRKTKHIGYFKDLNAAALARRQAEAGLGFHPNHGRKTS